MTTTTSELRSERERELVALSQRDPDAVLKIWREAAGVPADEKSKKEIDIRAVVVPAILAAEFDRSSD